MTSRSSTITKGRRSLPRRGPLPAVHPGGLLGEEIAARGASPRSFAAALRVPARRVSEIVDGKRGITPEMALRLGRYLGTGAEIWMNMQAAYDLATARQALAARIDAEVEPARAVAA